MEESNCFQQKWLKTQTLGELILQLVLAEDLSLCQRSVVLQNLTQMHSALGGVLSESV